MAIGNYYPLSPSVVDEDLFLGTKSGGNNTVNYTAQTVSNYLNTNSKIAIGGQISFRFDIAPNIPKTISFSGGGGDGTLFSNITQLIVSGIDLSSTDITIFLNYLNGSEILLSQQNQPNLFGHYKVTGYTQIGTSNFYTLDLDFIGGNGNITSNTFYNLNSFVLSSTIAVPNLNSVLTVGNTSLLDAKIGELYLYDGANSAYGKITNEDTSFVAYEYTGQKTFSVSSTDSQFIMINANNKSATFNSLPLTAARIYDLPNASGTIALTSDITPSALTKTDDTNVTLTLGGTPATSLLEAVSLTLGWAGTLADSRITSASTWNAKQDAISLTTIGSGVATFISNVLNIPTPASSPFASLTTTGSSGASTLIAGVLNVPTYTLSGLGGQPLATNLTSLSGLTYTSTSFVKMTAAGTFALDTNTYLTSAVTSVGITVPSAFSVTPSTITSSGTFAITGAGLTSQYVRGDGTLANFPTSTGGGSSFNYYLNGSISQGTFGGNTYYQMSRTPIFGAGTNFTRTNGAGNGYIASFITDAGDPNQLNIPGGNWNIEFYFNASSGGGSPSFYAELYKVDVTNVFTLIASDSLNPEGITNGTTVDQYFTSIPVPQTSLLATDRLAVRIFVNTGGRTITLHTENGNLSEVLTTFSSGLTALNGLTQQVQYFAVGTSGSDFNISSATDTHTFNLPTASVSNRGALSSSDWTTFNNKQDALVSGTNIKSVNGFSLLGSGDLLVKGVHALVKPSAGGSVSVSVTSTALSAQAQTTNRLIVSPFIPSQTITCASLYINVATLAAGSNAQILIYSNLNGKPDTKIYQSANLDCSTTGNKIATTTQTFEAGNTYWIGVHTSATQSLTVISTSNLLPIFTTSTTQVSSFFITTTFGSAPTTFGTPSNNSGTMPYVGITI